MSESEMSESEMSESEMSIQIDEFSICNYLYDREYVNNENRGLKILMIGRICSGKTTYLDKLHKYLPTNCKRYDYDSGSLRNCNVKELSKYDASYTIESISISSVAPYIRHNADLIFITVINNATNDLNKIYDTFGCSYLTLKQFKKVYETIISNSQGMDRCILVLDIPGSEIYWYSNNSLEMSLTKIFLDRNKCLSKYMTDASESVVLSYME